MVSIYYAEIFLKCDTCDKIISLQTFGADEHDARRNVGTLIKTWQEVRDYEIIEIATREIFLQKWVVVATIKYKSGKSRQIKLNLKCKNKKEAAVFFKRIISDWNHVAGYEITTIEERS